MNAGGMSTGEVIAFINYVNMILLALMVVSNLVITFTKAYTSAGRVAEVLATQPAVSDSQHLVENPSSKAPAVAFSHVYFSYNDNQNDQYDLTDINAVIPKGATVGVIGGTGAGKSTLMNLIMRFFDVQSGEVQVDGINVTHYPMETLRSKIGLVPQKSELFSATIAQNIRWGKPDASDQEMRRLPPRPLNLLSDSRMALMPWWNEAEPICREVKSRGFQSPVHWCAVPKY